MFSKACEYGLRAVVYLAVESAEGRRVGIEEICENIEAPRHFTAKILQTLSRNRLVSSRKGINGGFYTEKRQAEKRLMDVVLAIDGDQLFEGCALGLKECSSTQPCPLHDQFVQIRGSLKKLLTENTIGGVADKWKDGGTFLRSLPR